MKKTQIDNKKSAKMAKKIDKNVIKIKKNTKKRLLRRENKNNKIVSKCNKKIVNTSKNDIEILNKINELNTNGKRTIVYFVDSFYPIIDGVVSVLDNYAKFMSDYYNVVVCSPKHKKKTYKAEKYFVLSTDSIYIKKQGYDLGFPQLDPKFIKYISLLKIDLIHVNSPFNMGTFGLDLAKKRHIPSITTFHSQFKQDFYKATKSAVLSSFLANMIIKVYDKSTLTLTMNDFSAGIMKEYGLKRNDVQIVPNATNLEYKEFDLQTEKNVLQKYNIKKEQFNILFIGRFVKVKNVYLILDVLKELYILNQNFQFIFMGYGPEEEKMKKIIHENNLENNIVFTGKVLDVDEKAIIIKNSDLLFFPSVYDTDGIVKIESACYSVPTLCLENTGVSSGIKNNETGFVEKNDVKLLAERLNELSKNVDFVKKIGKNAKDSLYVTWNDVGNKLKKIYEKLFATKNLKSIKNKKKINKKYKF